MLMRQQKRAAIEISDKHRSALLSIAAQKGLRGYSKIIDFFSGTEPAVCAKWDVLKNIKT